MTDCSKDMSPRRAAFIAGLGITIMLVAAVVATDGTMGRLIVKGDAAATTANIMASETTILVSIFSWLVDMTANLVVAWALYVLLRPVNRDLSLLSAWLRVAYVAVFAAALTNLVSLLPLVSGAGNTAAYTEGQLQALVMSSLGTFDAMWSLGLVIFGFHILVLGHLVLTSGYVPKFFGVLLIIAFFGYLIVFLGKLFVPGYEAYETVIGLLFMPAMVIGEVGLGLWLLIKGVKVSPQNEPALQAA